MRICDAGGEHGEQGCYFMRSDFGRHNDAAEVVEPLRGVMVWEGGLVCLRGCGVGGLVVK